MIMCYFVCKLKQQLNQLIKLKQQLNQLIKLKQQLDQLIKLKQKLNQLIYSLAFKCHFVRGNEITTSIFASKKA